MTEHATNPTASPTRKLRAAIVGLGLDGDGGPRRVLTTPEMLVVGGSAATHAELTEMMLRLESELERKGQNLADLPPDDLAELACRIDSPELLQIALRLQDEIELRGASFDSLSAEELTRLAASAAS